LRVVPIVPARPGRMGKMERSATSERAPRDGRRTPARGFRPDYLSFAGTLQCNLLLT